MDAGDLVPPPGDDAPETGPAGPGPGAGDVRCKMRRGDGSEWTVTGLSLAPDGLRITGYRYVRDREAPAESRREVLDDELLRSEDLVWCLDRRGSVVWRLASPEASRSPTRGGPGTVPPGGSLGGAPGAGEAGLAAGGGDVPPGGGGPTGG